MNRLFAFFVSLVCFLPAMAADSIQVKGNLASFYSLTQNGCIATNRFLLASDESVRLSGGDGGDRRLLFVTEFVFDSCNNVEVSSSSGFVELQKDEFSISVGGARLMANLQMSGTFGIETRYVDLTWSPTEKTWNGAYTNNFPGPGYTILARYNGSSQRAKVTGTFGAESVNVSGYLDNVKTGTIVIEKK